MDVVGSTPARTTPVRRVEPQREAVEPAATPPAEEARRDTFDVEHAQTSERAAEPGHVGAEPSADFLSQLYSANRIDSEALFSAQKDLRAPEGITNDVESGRAIGSVGGRRQTREDRDLDDRMRRAGVPPAQRQRILNHLGTLDPAARAREEGMIQHALSSRNADRAIATYDKLLQIARTSERAAQRLTPDVREALVRGVADSRTDTDTGQEGVIGARQAEEAARALVEMPEKQYAAVRGMLDRAGTDADGDPVKGADANTERALILKAVAARRHELQRTPGNTMADVARFADDIRGMQRDALVRATTSLGVHRDDIGPDPDNLRGGNTQRGVGLYQRLEDSCGPTTAQLVRAERDPIYALRLHREGNGGGDSEIKREQRRALERPRFYDENYRPVRVSPQDEARFKRDGTMPPGARHVSWGVGVSRLGSQAEQRLREKLDSPWALANLRDDEADALRRHARNERLTPEQERLAQEALCKVRDADDGHPTDEELEAMRSNYIRNPDGTSTRKAGDGMRLDDALDDIAPAAPGRSWRARDTNGGRGGMSGADVDDVERRLRAGEDVPIRIGNRHDQERDGHFMLVSDVRGRPPNRSFLVSDPWTGRTAWVPEREMRSPRSDWPRRHFNLQPDATVTTTYVEQ